MTSPTATLLQFDAQATTLDNGAAPPCRLAVSLAELAGTVLRHDPPTPYALEQGIDIIEMAIMDRRPPQGEGGGLATTEPAFAALLPPGQPSIRLTRDAVERLFQALAAVAQGDHRAASELPRGQDFAAALLILRECMHHLDYGWVDLNRTPA